MGTTRRTYLYEYPPEEDLETSVGRRPACQAYTGDTGKIRPQDAAVPEIRLRYASYQSRWREERSAR